MVYANIYCYSRYIGIPIAMRGYCPPPTSCHQLKFVCPPSSLPMLYLTSPPVIPHITYSSWEPCTMEAAQSTLSPISTPGLSITFASRRFRRWGHRTARLPPTIPSRPASTPMLRPTWQQRLLSAAVWLPTRKSRWVFGKVIEVLYEGFAEAKQS